VPCPFATPVPEIGNHATSEYQESQLERDLLVGNTPWVLKAIEEHCITHTIASRLLAVAEKYKRMDEFRDEFIRWKKEIRKALHRRTKSVAATTRMS